MIVIWAPYDSATARRLSTAITAENAQCVRIKHKDSPVPHGFIVNWGSQSCPKYANLNSKAPIGNKLKELKKLSAAGVPVPKYMTEMPGQAGWLARKLHHVNGSDLAPDASPLDADFWTKIVTCPREFRVHVFNGKSILLGERAPMVAKHHPWIRTTDNGWDIVYPSMEPGKDPIGHSLRVTLRAVAIKAVKAVGYDFGAVDIGLQETGDLVVFEVNSAPGLDPGAELNRYRDAIIGASQEG